MPVDSRSLPSFRSPDECRERHIGESVRGMTNHRDPRWFFVIGAMKAGTSSLYQYLACHPLIYASPIKEPGYFALASPTCADTHRYFSLFANRTVEEWAFEASTCYSKAPRIAGVAERIQHRFPDARFIYVLRNPIDRVYSHFLDNWIERGDREPFESAVLRADSHYVSVSRYYFQLCQYLDRFPHRNLHVVIFERMIRDPASTIKGICQFLELEFAADSVPANTAHNVTAKKRPYSPWARWISSQPWYARVPRPIRHLGGTLLGSYIRPKCLELSDVRSPQRDRALAELLHDDVEQLEAFLQMDLWDWDIRGTSTDDDQSTLEAHACLTADCAHSTH